MAMFNFNEQVGPLGFGGGGLNNQGETSFNPYAMVAYWNANPAAREQANAILKPYGVSVPTSLPTNFIFPGVDSGQGWAGAHPHIANAIQGGLLGAALTPGAQGPEGAGQGFSRAMQGVLGVSPYLQSRAMQYYQAPFAAADVTSGLIARQAESQFYQKYADAMDNRAQTAMDRASLQRPYAVGGEIYQDVYDPTTESFSTKDLGAAPDNQRGQLYNMANGGVGWLQPSNQPGAIPSFTPIPGSAPKAPTAQPNLGDLAAQSISRIVAQTPGLTPLQQEHLTLNLLKEYNASNAGGEAAARTTQTANAISGSKLQQDTLDQLNRLQQDMTVAATKTDQIPLDPDAQASLTAGINQQIDSLRAWINSGKSGLPPDVKTAQLQSAYNQLIQESGGGAPQGAAPQAALPPGGATGPAGTHNFIWNGKTIVPAGQSPATKGGPRAATPTPKAAPAAAVRQAQRPQAATPVPNNVSAGGGGFNPLTGSIQLVNPTGGPPMYAIPGVGVLPAGAPGAPLINPIPH